MARSRGAVARPGSGRERAVKLDRYRSRAKRAPLVAYREASNRAVVPTERALLGRRLDLLAPGAVTVVTVNWNTLEHLKTLRTMVRRHSPPETRIIAVDNASTDGSREWIKEQGDVDGILLPFNIHHGPAADRGALAARSEFLILLDVDAFPLSDAWLPAVLDPLRAGCTVAGGFIHREYVHPSYFAMRLRDFVERKRSFATVQRWHPGVEAGAAGFRDAGENISLLERAEFGEQTTHFIPVSSTRGPGLLGTVFGDVVYHNFFTTGYGAAADRADQTSQAWHEAVERYVTTPAAAER
jgi:glycosyltransferase involved in cell wall biosynthesis